MFTIDVLALGESVHAYRDKGNVTIGVNDIFRFYPVDFLVIADPPSRFVQERKSVILNSTPKRFFSSFDDWRQLVNNFKILKLTKGRGRLDKFDSEICFSNNSPFIAVCLAYHMGAKRIVLHGVDLKSHPALSRPNMLAASLKDYDNLNKALLKRNVDLFISSPMSELNKVVRVL